MAPQRGARNRDEVGLVTDFEGGLWRKHAFPAPARRQLLFDGSGPQGDARLSGLTLGWFPPTPSAWCRVCPARYDTGWASETHMHSA
jgi:hypothetical protein